MMEKLFNCAGRNMELKTSSLKEIELYSVLGYDYHESKIGYTEQNGVGDS